MQVRKVVYDFGSDVPILRYPHLLKLAEALHSMPDMSKLLIHVGRLIRNGIGIKGDFVPLPIGSEGTYEKANVEAVKAVQKAYKRQGWTYPGVTYMVLSGASE
jgi:hypothetical protein